MVAVPLVHIGGDGVTSKLLNKTPLDGILLGTWRGIFWQIWHELNYFIIFCLHLPRPQSSLMVLCW